MRRPDLFTLDYSHPLAQGLVFAGLGLRSSAKRYVSSVFGHGGNIIPSANGCLSWVEYAGRRMLENNRTGQTTSDLSYIDIADSPLLDLPSSFTVSALTVPYEISYGTYAAATHTIVTKEKTIWDPSLDRNYRLGHQNSTIFCNVSSGGVSYRVIGDAGAMSVARKPYHVCMSYDGTTVSLFLNGNKQADTLAIASVATNAGPLRIFREFSTSAYNLKGLVGDILIHNRALSTAEIALLADRTDPMLGGLIVEERPVLYFDMGGSTTVNGPFTLTVDTSLGLGGYKTAISTASFTNTSALNVVGTKAASGPASFTNASAFVVDGVVSQSDDKVMPVSFVNEAVVGIGGFKSALGAVGISHAAELGVSGEKGVLMPELSQATGAAVSSSEISGSVYTNKNTGTLYAVATLSSSKPSVAQVQAGQNHLGATTPYATSQAVSTYGLQSVAADGLTFNTPYYWHFQHKDGDDIDSTVITSAAVRTLDASITLAFDNAAPCSLMAFLATSNLSMSDAELKALLDGE